MGTRFLVVSLALGLATADCRSSERVDADNTRNNERDRSGVTKTPGDQKENDVDRTITQQIRKGVIASDELSQTAKNVKIVTQDGVVTLRGPVANENEREKIASFAESAAGVTRVENELEVKQD